MEQGYNDTLQEDVYGWFHTGFLIFPVANLAHNRLTLLFDDHSVSLGYVQMETQSPYFQLVISKDNSHPPPPMRPHPPQKKKIEPPCTEAKIRAEMATA